MHIANIHDAKAQLSSLIQRALAGEEVIIARAGDPLVQLIPVQFSTHPRSGGQLKGKIRLAEDFDAPDAGLEALFYGAPESP
jgi:prevent-host-death family protein